MRRRIIAFFFGVTLAVTISSLEIAWGQLPTPGGGDPSSCFWDGCTPHQNCFGSQCSLDGCYRNHKGKITQCNYACVDSFCVVAY